VLVQNTRLEEALNKFKLQPRYLGPYEVVCQTTNSNYILMELDGTIHQQTYAGFRLISYIQRDDPVLQEIYDDDEDEMLEQVPDEFQSRTDMIESEAEVDLDSSTGSEFDN
jgi:hypothetical protein